MKRVIPYGHQDISEADIDAVVETLRSDWLTQGPAILRFEESLSRHCEVPHAVAVSNATAALHVACLALGVGPGDSLWTSPNTFVASANCARYCGATVDFVDIDPKTLNLSVPALERKLLNAQKQKKLPKVVIPVHFAGQSCEMEKIGALARRFGFHVIEDASHAIGGEYLGKPVGTCEHSDMTVFSFHPVKIITTAEGGMITTRKKELFDRLMRLRSHGITRDPKLLTLPDAGAWYYEQHDLGFNYRMTDLQAALGTSQLTRLEEFIRAREERVEIYRTQLAELPLRMQSPAEGVRSAHHLFVIRVDPDRTKKKRREVFDSLREAGIGVNVHYIPVHLQPYYRALGFGSGDFPEAEKYYEEAISLPMYSSLTRVDQDRVIAAVRSAFA
ncbi:MAG: UDP-4-amino-4,6-dideoxy-N-acetyl-beta-L-altrosamine transaminase [Bdellovibrionota bacterium]